jgi:uncharacterized membrane protein
MIVKVFKATWFFSLMATVAAFLYVYASLPEVILLREGEGALSISRETLFYSTLALLTILNSLIFIISKLYVHHPDYFRAWFYGLMVFLNLFVIVVLEFLNVYNSGEKYNYDSLGIVIYGSLGLIVLWSSLWPFYSIAQRIFNKQSV